MLSILHIRRTSMLFTYEGYKALTDLLKAHGYNFGSYDTWQEQDGKCAIMRHDIDNDPRLTPSNSHSSELSRAFTAYISRC